MPVLNVPTFTGIVLEGSPDAQRPSELSVCDGYDLGARGQLQAASDVTGSFNVTNAAAATLTRVFGLAVSASPQNPLVVAAGDTGGGGVAAAVHAYNPSTFAGASFATAVLAGTYAQNVTFVTVPYVDAAGVQKRLVLVNFGARPAQDPRTTLGLYVLSVDGAGTLGFQAISKYDALGTGALGEYFIASGIAGTLSKQLYPRGVFLYNQHVFLYGFDDHDAAKGDGPNRAMFSNIGNPLKYGLDGAPPPAVEANRSFTDSDAIVIGGAGESIRAGLVWAGKAWLGTNAGLHYIEGYGRESFQTNGAVAIRKSSGVCGPRGLIEGPDGLLHGVDAYGHWIFTGSDTERVGNVLRDFAGHSAGYWDCIWTDTSRADGYPGMSNQDLVWMLSRPDLMQVWIVMPFCNATAGYGYGTDTVVVKYHIRTGGYTRQIFTGQTLTAGFVFQREGSADQQELIATPGAAFNVSKYALKANPSVSPVLPTSLPVVTFGDYSPFGPDGIGVVRKFYLTLSWESGSALPLVFTLTPTVDGRPETPVTLTIKSTAPAGPANGDLWVDTSGTDTNLGNGTAGAIVTANPNDFILRRWVTTWAKWVAVPTGTEQGYRATIPLAFEWKKGTRVRFKVACTTGTGRYQIEGFGEQPNPIRSNK